jgi:general secretion pathway protein D
MSYLALPNVPPHGLTASERAVTSRGVLRPSKVLLSALLAAATAFAQNPATPAVPRPGNNVPPAPTAPAVPPLPGTPAAAAIPGAGLEALEPLQFPNTDVKDVLEFYSKKTGRKLIYSNQLVGSIYLSIGPVNRSDAIKIIEMSLAMNGFYVVPTEDPNIWRVTGVGQNPKTVGVPFIDKEELLPADDQVVMYLFKLEWQDPTELAQTLGTGVLMPNQAGFTSVVPLPKASALLVTETTSNIRTLIRVVRAIDTKPADVVSEFITLTHAQAEDVVTNLEKLFEKTPTQQTTGAPGVPGGVQGRTQTVVQRTVTDGQGNPLPTTGGVPAEGSVSIEIDGGSVGIKPTEDNIIIGKLKLTADKRTNRIHVVTRPVNLPFIRDLVDEYDANVKLPQPFVRPLRHRPVEEVMEAIVSAIQDPGDKAGAAGAGGTGQLGQRPGTNQGTGQGGGNLGNNRFGGGAAGGAGGAGGGTDASGTAGALGESLTVSAVETRPLSQQVGKSTIIADQRNNSIIVVGTQDVKDKVSLLLDELDVRQAQVMIHTVIGELRLGRNEKFGIDWILRNGGILAPSTTTPPTDPGTPTTPTSSNVVGFNDAGQPVLDLNNLITQQNITKVLTGGSAGLSGAILSGDNFTAVVNAFENNNRFRVVTRPSIFTTNAKRAVITSGEEVPVPTNIQSSFQGGNNDLVSNSSIQFKPIELRLEVLPLINDDKEVSLEIVQNISERAGSTIIDNNAIPNISRRAIKTYVTVPNNSTLILGGLIKESKDFTKGGIFKLINIPIIGPLFGTTTKDRIRNELIIMMRPIVTYAPSDAARLREKTFEAFAIPPDLESAIMPVGIWDRIPKAKIVTPAPRSTAPILREESTRSLRK